MPSSPSGACLVPLCPNRAERRGRCGLHQQTTSERGYGTEHQRERADGLATARCANCGCTNELQLDHVVPKSLGGDKTRWLCDCPMHRCHSRLGKRSTSRVA